MSVPDSTRFGRVLAAIAMLSGVATLGLGLVVLLGWYTGNRTLIQVLPQFVPMQYNTALGFVFSGEAMLALLYDRRRVAAVAGALLLLIGGLTLVEYIADVDLGIDELFMTHDITVETSSPGRMAPNTATCFALLGLAVVVVPRGWSPRLHALIRVTLASLAFSLAMVALSGYFTHLETAYGWGNLTRMAVHTSAGFIIVSTGFLSIAWRRDLGVVGWTPRWLPVPLFITLLTATLCFWQALAAQRVRIERQAADLDSLADFGVVMLLGGGLLAITMASVAWLAQRSSQRAREVLRANHALEHARETTLTELLESAPDAMMVTDRAGVICRGNAKVTELFGYRRETLVGMNVIELLPTRFRSGHDQKMQGVFEAATSREMAAGIELHGTREDGSEFPIEIGLSPFHDPEGMMVVAAIRDITRRKAAEAELREKEERFRTLVANLPETIYRCLRDADCTMQFISDDVADLTGYPASDFIDNAERTFDSVIHPDDREHVAAAIGAAVPADLPWLIEYRIVRIDDAVRWVEDRGRAMRGGRDDPGFLDGVIGDITERKRMAEEIEVARQQAEAANRAKSEFLSHMSHELRTPLNGVLGYAQILQRDAAATPKQRQSLDAIVSCGSHLLALINDVLDLSKIEAGQLEVDERPCDLSAIVRGVRDVVEQRASAKHVRVETVVSPEVPQGIVTDEKKLRQILVNLMGNAVKFTEAGSVGLRVAERPRGRLRFEIADTGVGMSKDELAHIFDPFKQVQAGKAAGGTGLGLSITRRFVEALGGRIDVQSEVGRGSLFIVELPLVEASSEDLGGLEAQGSLAYGAAVLAPGQTRTVLVVDDRETNRDILERMLDSAGFVSVTADDGDTALETLRARDDIDLVLMDVRMPRMNGTEAVKQIRADERLRTMKVIAVTASVFPEFRRKAIESGFDDFLGKPFRTEELMETLARHLDVEFVVSESDAIPPDDPDATDEAITLSPDLAVRVSGRIREALELGNITALNRLAAELDETPTTAACGRRIGQLTRAFDFDGLRRLADEVEAARGG